MRTTLAALALALLSGCSTTSALLSNRIACTIAKDAAFYVSMYGSIGVASRIADADAAVLCGR